MTELLLVEEIPHFRTGMTRNYFAGWENDACLPT